MAIPSGDIKEPAEDSNAEDAVEHALARRHAEPLARNASHDGGGGHCDHEAKCLPRPPPPRTTESLPDGCGPRTNQNTVMIQGQEQRVLSRYQTL